jgi:hypothetical protein
MYVREVKYVIRVHFVGVLFDALNNMYCLFLLSLLFVNFYFY